MGMSNQTEEKELFHAVSLSGGKDSTAMLLLMVERGLPIHAVLTADTGMEFPEMYEHLQKLDDYLFAERGLHLTWLRHHRDLHRGAGYCGPRGSRHCPGRRRQGDADRRRGACDPVLQL